MYAFVKRLNQISACYQFWLLGIYEEKEYTVYGGAYMRVIYVQIGDCLYCAFQYEGLSIWFAKAFTVDWTSERCENKFLSLIKHVKMLQRYDESARTI